MPGNIYLPPQENPWAQSMNQLGNLITQLALMKVAQNFREKEAAIEDLRATTREQTRTKTAAAMEGWRPAEGEEQRAPGAGAVEIGGTQMMPPTPEIIDIPGTDIKGLKYGGKITPITTEKGESKTWIVPDPNGNWEIKGQRYRVTSTRATSQEARRLEQAGGFELPAAAVTELLGLGKLDTASPLKEFEQAVYGKEVPELRGTPDYMNKRKQYAADVRAFNIFGGVDAQGNPIIIPGRGAPSAQVVPSPTPILPRSSTVLTEDEKKDYQSLGNATDLIRTLEGQWTTIAPATRADATVLYGQAKTGFHPSAKGYIDQRDALLGQLSRSIAAERGVLTNQDIDRIGKALPRIGLNPLNSDSAKEAQIKWNQIYGILKKAEKRMYERTQMKARESVPEEGIVKRGKLDVGTAKDYLQRAGGDKDKARELAKSEGWEF